MTGVINVYKEKGYTSFDVVAIIRKLLSGGPKAKKIKTGHTGTLDPQAEGVLPICVGRATKLAGHLTAAEKSYRAELILGITTDTYDNTGQILSESPVNFDMKEIERAITCFDRGYMQVPPMYSALKVNGQRLHQLARAGKTVERSPRKVEISRISIIDTDPASNRLVLDVDCGKGTYIRSLCADIGQKLGCGGCMGDLTRTRSGAFHIENALRISQLKQAAEENNRDFLIPVDEAFSAPKGILNSFFKEAVNGRSIPPAYCSFDKELLEGGFCWLYGKENSDENFLIGLFIMKDGKLKPEVMMYENYT